MSAQPTASLPAGASDRFAPLRALTEQIRECMLARQWTRAAELDLERRAGIAELFERRATAEELPELVAGLRELLMRNDELLGLMAHQRRSLDRRADTLSVARRMSSAYHTSRPRR